jgi:hypothetical protein
VGIVVGQERGRMGFGCVLGGIIGSLVKSSGLVEKILNWNAS